ncbi:tetratricopeptide repeat protein [Colwellia hornerae]|uniref:Tetratricopeptide repeat protein n=1 Tax=Colwellia hornerae TaxID=89402 RepID=A0A5C6QNQ2_9GAMM|nr:tetratricopeptide repeat protein [Colwellia hornerae]TWX54650.1 tetratricopeptide repeat protein [Colwellia hornerae]TWX61090.1 tetratricopeptide repeat protein [Colwellia hornerae]TWX70343.1 tetratricopeptide repeat protein [Colwellia hornerae]
MTKITTLKRKALSCFAIALLFNAPVILNQNIGGNIAYAQSSAKSGKKITSVKVPAMRNRVYTQLARAQKLADEGNGLEGFDVLDEVQDRIESLNSYERAMLWNFYGFMYYGNDDVASAIDSFEQVIKEKAIPETLRLSTLYSLAQLSMQMQNFPQSLKFLALWQATNDKVITDTQKVLFAQVHYQNKDYQQSLNYVSQAIEQSIAANEVPKESWLVLQRANYFELKRPIEVTGVIENLVRYYNKPKYWLQLSAMYGETGQEDKQLAVMESAWQAGYVTQSTDIVTLVQLYRFHNVPIKAANLLAEAIDSGQVIAQEKYLEMLANAYIAAKDDEKSIPVLIKAAEISETGKFDAALAQTYLNLEKWQLAINSANEALSRGGLDSEVSLGHMHLAKGMAEFNLQNFDQSLSAFKQAKKIKSSAKTAKQWFLYVEKEQRAKQNLAMLN